MADLMTQDPGFKPFVEPMGKPAFDYTQLGAGADIYNQSAAQYMPYIQKILERMPTEQPLSLAPGLTHMMTTPIYDDPNLAGLGGIDTRQAYQDRNATINTGTAFMKERNAEALQPTSMVKALADSMKETTAAGENVAKTAKTRAETDTGWLGEKSMKEGYGKSAGEYAAQRTFAYSTPGANEPLPAHIVKATGFQTRGDLLAALGKSSADVFGRGLQYLGQVEGAGITAGGMKESAKIQALGGILKESHDVVKEELKRLSKMKEVLSVDVMAKRPDALKQNAEIDRQISVKQGELSNIQNNLNGLLGKSATKLGYDDAVKPNGQSATPKVGDVYKGVKVEAIINGRPVATDPSDGKRKYLN